MNDSLKQLALAEDALNRISQNENSMQVIYAVDTALREFWKLRRVIEQQEQDERLNNEI